MNQKLTPTDSRSGAQAGTSPARRIVSLLPSATEIVCALGLEHELVGRSHECDYPPTVERLPVLTAPRFDPSGSSREVDRRVRAIVSEALSVYRVDAERLRSLSPGYIVTQSQCEVCAVSESDVERAVADWTGTHPQVVSLRTADLDGVWSDIERVGAALGVADRGLETAAALRQRASTIRERAADAGYRPGMACIEWIEPLMAAGNWMPEMVEIAGGRDLFGKRGGHSPVISFDDLCAVNPEIILIAPCGFPIERSLAELPTLMKDPRWSELEAVTSGRVLLADGNQYFNRPGPRIAESIEILAEIIHPTIFHFGHEGSGWQRL
ncbi:MAG TPA: cobalamin-binding protein [Candidatus Binataceae bacterium]|nr:cobalamin-binding protein [Candidatus Binataceae bacterium]